MEHRILSTIARKKKSLIVAAMLLLLAGGSYLFYTLYFQILPQNVIYILKDVDPPVKSDKVLVFAPHPDDETIGAGGFIQRAVSVGAQVWIVLVTDGNKHHLGPRRLDEFKDSCAALGVPDQHLFTLGYPDSRLKKVNRRVVASRFKSFIDTIKPTVVVYPVVADKHPDHGTTGKIVYSLISNSPVKKYEYLVHHPRFPRPEGLKPEAYMIPPTRLVNSGLDWRRFMLTEHEEDIKLEAVLKYKTQLKYTIPRNMLFGMVRRNELFAIPGPAAAH